VRGVAFVSRAALGLVLAAAPSGGCVDTELSLDAQVRAASVTLGADDVIEVELEMDVRVGKYAIAGDDFVIPQVGLFVGDAPVAEVNLERPEGFDGRLEPGESTTVTLRGATLPGAYPAARGVLCGGGEVEVTVVAEWTAQQQPDDPLDPPIMSFGVAEGSTRDVGCE